MFVINPNVHANEAALLRSAEKLGKKEVKEIMLTKKLATGVATASLLLATFAPAAFAQTVDVSGNGTQSHNTVTVNSGDTTVVDQSTTTHATTTVNSTANTGGNTANGNTGGDVTIDTGMASNSTTVSVTGGDNTAVVPDACGCSALSDVTVSGNGSNSKNKVTLNGGSTTVLSQYAKTKATTTVNNTAKTGKNKANNNTGGGVGITTNDASNTTHVTVSGGSNLFGSVFSLLGL